MNAHPAATLFWRRRWLVVVGVLVTFAAIVAAWFIPDGYVQTMRAGQPVCCGQVIDRGWIRTGVAVIGAGLGAASILFGLLRRGRQPTSDAAGADHVA